MDGLKNIVACPCMARIFLTVGGIYCTVTLLRVLSTILNIVRTFTGAKDLKQYGSWAIVTGGTDGIGKAVAKQLAKQKINLLLISRNQDKLNTVAKEISDKYKVEVRTEALDLASATPDDYAKLSKSYGDLDIGIIVNNVGLSYDHPEYLETAETSRLCDIIQVNTLPCTLLTRAFIGSMVNNKRGLVVNVSSMSSLLATPLLSVYSASKAYINTLTECLQTEYSEKGLHFQVICPMYVSTSMTGMKPSLACPTPDTYAQAAVATFGKTTFTNGYWPHSLQATLYSYVPSFYFVSSQLTAMKRGRARWYRKQELKKE